MKTYFKYALCIIRDNHLLVQEEWDNENYLMPGGKPEPGETPEQALTREIKEELGVNLELNTIKHLGVFEDRAAGNPDAMVHLDLFTADFTGELAPCSEVKRLVWFSKDDDFSKLAPVTRNKIFPALLKQGLLH